MKFTPNSQFMLIQVWSLFKIFRHQHHGVLLIQWLTQIVRSGRCDFLKRSRLGLLIILDRLCLSQDLLSARCQHFLTKSQLGGEFPPILAHQLF